MACEVAWNPLDKGALYTLSEDNEAATKTASGWQALRATGAKNSGKLYFELILHIPSARSLVGIGLSTMSLSSYVGSDAAGWGWHANAATYFNGSFIATDVGYASDDVVQIAVDLDLGKIWFGVNNTWIDSGDPGAGTGEAYQNDLIKNNDIYIAGSSYYGASILRLRACDTDQIYTPPTGFTAWTVVPVAKLSGTVKERGVGVARRVQSYIRATGALYDSTVSEANGSFLLDAPDDTTEMFIIALDDAAGDQYNALIYDRVKGVM